MRIKPRLVVIFLSLICLLHACVSQTDYEKLQAEKKDIAAQLEEEKFGASKLLNEAKSFMDANDIVHAEEKINVLLSKHSDKTEALQAKEMLSQINDKKLIMNEDAAWQKANSIDEIGYTEQYINDYKSGRYISEARERLKQLKVQKESSDYEEALNSNNAYVWKQFLENYPNRLDKAAIKRRIIQAEVDEILQGEHGSLPSFSSDYSFTSGASESEVSITNKTEYTLTIRYSGPSVKMIDIPAGATRSVSLSSGTYKIAASVDAPNVNNYGGTESLSGKYNSSFYISSYRY